MKDYRVYDTPQLREQVVRDELEEWMSEHPNDPTVIAIRNWTGERDCDTYDDDGYCRLVKSVWDKVFCYFEVGSSSESHMLYGVMSDIISTHPKRDEKLIDDINKWLRTNVDEGEEGITDDEWSRLCEMIPTRSKTPLSTIAKHVKEFRMEE